MQGHYYLSFRWETVKVMQFNQLISLPVEGGVTSYLN